jgi:hypothetical protein
VVLEVTAQLRTSGSTEKTCSKILTNIWHPETVSVLVPKCK